MAKRNSRMSKKIEPAVLTFTLATPGTTAGTHYVDLSQIASLMNRRFYRQGINWAVAGFKFSSTRAGQVNVYKLPNTWVMSNAWEKSFRAWQRMNNEALAESESVRPRFLDFKIYADTQHHTAGFGANLLPFDSAGNQANTGEWESSKIVIPLTDGTDNALSRELIAVGANYPGNSAATGLNAVSLVEGYAASRGLPDIVSPNTPDDAASVNGGTPQNWMAATFNQGTDQDDLVIDDMITENNIAPYPFENDGVNVDTMYPGGANNLPALQWHDIVQLYSSSGTQSIGIQHGKGGSFPCGLIAINWTPEEPANLVMQIDLVPGNHRGYLCEPMTEM